MNGRYKLFFFVAVFLFMNGRTKTFAQQIDTIKINSKQLFVIIKNDGTEFVGPILFQDDREILIETMRMGRVYIPKHEIKEIREIDSKDLRDGEYVPDEVFSTRYFLTTNGLPIKKGENYILWNWWGPDFQFAIGKNFGMGIMTSWVGIPIIMNAKYTINLSSHLNIGVGALLGTGSWAVPEVGIALPFASMTYGNRRSNISFSAGYGAVYGNGSSEGRVLLSIAGMSKVGKKVSIVFDSFIFPATKNYVQTTPGGGTATYTQQGGALIIPGIRWQTGLNRAFQLGFCGVRYNGQAVPVPLPMLQWFQKL